MKVFISWSKPRSKAIALAFHEFLPDVIQDCEPFISTAIKSGSVWFANIALELKTAAAGVVFITPENQHEAWLNFESGAMLSQFTEQPLRPVLVELTDANYSGPLSSMNFTSLASQDSIRAMMWDINNQTERPLDKDRFDRAFNRGWAPFQEKVEEALAIRIETAAEETGKRDVESKVDELVGLARTISNQVANLRPAVAVTPRLPGTLDGVAERAKELASQRLALVSAEYMFRRVRLLNHEGVEGKIVGMGVGLDNENLTVRLDDGSIFMQDQPSISEVELVGGDEEDARLERERSYRVARFVNAHGGGNVTRDGVWLGKIRDAADDQSWIGLELEEDGPLQQMSVTSDMAYSSFRTLADGTNTL